MPLDTAVSQTAARTDWLARAETLTHAIAAQAGAHDADDSFVADAYAQLKAGGFFKALVPVEFGGGGAEVAEICQVIRRLGAACGSTALAFAMHSHLVAVAAWRWREQGAPTEGLLKRVAAEDLVLVSSGGSDWLASGGQAVKVEGGFKITARKAFSSGCLAGDLLVTSAVWADPEGGPTVLHFAVPLKAPGVARHRLARRGANRGVRAGSGDLGPPAQRSLAPAVPHHRHDRLRADLLGLCRRRRGRAGTSPRERPPQIAGSFRGGTGRRDRERLRQHRDGLGADGRRRPERRARSGDY
jgi:hypothetical protein